MIYIDELQQSFKDFDELIHWFCEDFPNDDTINKEAECFIKYHFPDIDLAKFWVTCHITKYHDAGHIYTQLSIEYNTNELKRCYPEYFL